MPDVVRVGVVGVGVMGYNHARVLSGLKGAELTAVLDANEQRAAEVASVFDVEAVPDIDALAERVDAVTVAVPSGLHSDIGCQLLARGLHCLVEKPLAPSASEGRALMRVAEDSGVHLAVGHVERFNPAVEQLASILEGETLLAFEARRMSAVSGRVTDVDVISDLMVHDLDIILSLVGGQVETLQAMAAGAGTQRDFVSALLGFEGGAVANVTASRITQNQIRSLQVTTAERFYTVDYPAQELHIYRQGRVGNLDSDDTDGRYVLDVGTERVFVRRAEPLAVELAHFLDVVRGRCEPRVSGSDACRVLELVEALQREVGRS